MPANKPNPTNYKPTRPDTPMAWSVKRTNLPRPSIKKLPFMFACYPTFICAWVTYLMWDRIDEDPTSWLIACGSSIIAALLLLLIMLQKSVFHYRIHADHGEVEYQLYYPKLSGDFFISFAALILFILMIITVLTGSLLFLAGATSLAILPAIRLLKWEPPAAQHETSLPWIRHHFVTVDRKYLIIVVHTTDTTTGFKARFPNKELFEQYLAFLHTAVAPQAEFTEKVWEW